MNLAIEEKVVFENLYLAVSEWSGKMQSNVPFLLDSLIFRVVLYFAETLHEDLEVSPMPVGFGQEESSNLFADSSGRA